MSAQIFNRTIIKENIGRVSRRWLLGNLSKSEAELFEATLLNDEKLYAGLTAATDNLINDYVADRLQKIEKDAFEAVFYNNRSRANGGGEINITAGLESFIKRKN